MSRPELTTTKTPTLVSLHRIPFTFSLIFIYFSMPLQDRTNEFLACVESIRTRSSLPTNPPGKQRLLDKQARADGKSEFTRMANAIGKDISGTTTKLGKLAQCEHPHPSFTSGSLTPMASCSGQTENAV